MKKCFLVMFVLFMGYATVHANPVDDAQGVVSYSVNYTVFFDSEKNASNWLQQQTDFLLHNEVSAGQRRIMESVIANMVPSLADVVRLNSDFCVMVVRSSSPGQSSLQFYVRGTLTRLWQY